MSKRGNGEGSIYQAASGRWRGVVDLGWKNGKRDRRYLTGFNWWSQHFDRGGVDGKASGVDEGVDGQVADEVAGCAVALTDAPRGADAQIEDVLTKEEALALIAGCRGTTLGATVICTLGTGLRRGEVLGLTWSEIDLDEETANVVQTLSRRKGKGLVTSEPKTERSRRVVPLPAFAIAAFREQRARQAAERLAAGPEWIDTGFVFTTPKGTPLDPDNVTTRFADLTERLGLGRRRFKSLRHSCATTMLAAGVPLEVVSRTLGHAGLEITANIYARVLPPAQRDAADRIQEALGAS
ncbi:MAG: site-specific integrase [Acidimicrobiia bacterium]|nr:site-specific integrase [Acidimicrobiia bacterium]